MGKAFDSCVAQGGRVRTKKLPKNRYQRICFIGGKTFAGHIKRRKNK